MAEWTTMKAREILVRSKPPEPFFPLVYPIVFSDGEHFPEEAKTIQSELDFRAFAYPYAVFQKSEKYLDFHDRVQWVAEDLAKRLRAPPPWDPEWAALAPDSETLPKGKFSSRRFVRL
jgi:hypothetical protein